VHSVQEAGMIVEKEAVFILIMRCEGEGELQLKCWIENQPNVHVLLVRPINGELLRKR
jgi:hypothetical protein